MVNGELGAVGLPVRSHVEDHLLNEREIAIILLQVMVESLALVQTLRPKWTVLSHVKVQDIPPLSPLSFLRMHLSFVKDTSSILNKTVRFS